MTPHAEAQSYIYNGLRAKLAMFDKAAMDQYNLAHPQDKKNFYIAKVSGALQNTCIQLKEDQNKLQTLRQSDAAALMLWAKSRTVRAMAREGGLRRLPVVAVAVALAARHSTIRIWAASQRKVAGTAFEWEAEAAAPGADACSGHHARLHESRGRRRT